MTGPKASHQRVRVFNPDTDNHECARLSPIRDTPTIKVPGIGLPEERPSSKS